MKFRLAGGGGGGGGGGGAVGRLVHTKFMKFRLAGGGGGGGLVGWCDGTGVTSGAEASYNLDTVGQGPTALVVGAGGGCLDIVTLIYPFSPLSPSL